MDIMIKDKMILNLVYFLFYGNILIFYFKKLNIMYIRYIVIKI